MKDEVRKPVAWHSGKLRCKYDLLLARNAKRHLYPKTTVILKGTRRFLSMRD
jgi:hypothetical protein